MSFTKGMNGLNAAQKNLEVIGNNVSNANTIGFKAGQLYFAEVFANSQSSTTSLTDSSGAATAAVRPQFVQGALNVTNNVFDCALNGDGMFVLSDNGSKTYTRAGQFSLNKDGYLVNPSGARVQGFLPGSGGALGTDNPVDLKLNLTEADPAATTKATLAANLDSRKAALDPAGFRLNDASTYHNATSLQVYDEQGAEHNLSMYFAKAADGGWNLFAGVDGRQVGTGPVTKLAFDTAGNLASASPITLEVPFDGANPSISLDLGSITATGRSFGVSSVSQDGMPSGELSGYSVGSDGAITGRYSNGVTKTLGRLALARFNNMQGLRPIGTNGFAETAESGPAVIGEPSVGMFGTVQSGSLEGSNVDLTEELVKMIEAQRVYQANAQAIKAEDTILQTMINAR